MPGTLIQIADEVTRRLVAAGLWIPALVFVVCVAVLVVGARRGWFDLEPAPPLDQPREPDVPSPTPPPASWGENVEPHCAPDDEEIKGG
jgi:hypothetical protein